VGKDTEGSADLVNHGRRVGGEMDAQHAGRKCSRSLQILAYRLLLFYGYLSVQCMSFLTFLYHSKVKRKYHSVAKDEKN
jgi:hypothetical protein